MKKNNAIIGDLLGNFRVAPFEKQPTRHEILRGTTFFCLLWSYLLQTRFSLVKYTNSTILYTSINS